MKINTLRNNIGIFMTTPKYVRNLKPFYSANTNTTATKISYI